MSLLHYIDNEVPTFGEWDAIVGNVSQATEAALPERGGYGLRCSVSGGNYAYARKDFASALSAMAVGFWFKFPTAPTWTDGQYFFLAKAGVMGFVLYLRNDSGSAHLELAVYAGGDGTTYSDTYYLEPGRWYYIAIIATWDGSAGTADLYIDGVHRGQAQQAGNATFNRPDEIKMGNSVFCSGSAATLDLDEIKVRDDTTYPEPYVPTPADEYPSAERTAVLWRGASDDSRQFGDYCVAALGVPRANLIRLDNASANEALASYATFQTEVEDDIATYLGLHPTVAANCSCFLIGYGVPGCFLDGALFHSAASRLMNYGTAFSSGAANPLYKPSTVARLTKTALGGKYLCARIDADTLQHAKDVIDRAATVSALAALADADKLYSDDDGYKASADCQRLRILTAALGTYSGDAFVWGDTGTPAFGAPGSRACFADDSDMSAFLLRSGSGACYTALYVGQYAAALGSTHTADTFDAGSFFEMLRIGGTLAEAAIVAASKLDYTAVPVGSPLMTVAFQVSGYNVYRGIGGPDSIDYAAPVAYVRAGLATADLVGLGHVADVDHYYAVRAVSDSGVEETNTDRRVCVRINGAGQLVGPPPNRIVSAQISAAKGGKIRLQCFYSAVGAVGVATGIQVARIAETGPDWGSLIQTLAISGTRRLDVILDPTFDDGETVRLAVRAVTADAVTGPALRTNSVSADAVGPPAVEWLQAAQVSS